jgi:hypothetical protein
MTSVTKPSVFYRLHYYSGLLLSAFLVLHLGNHLFAWGGPELHIRVMKYLRVIYRWPPGEVLLLGAVVLQIITGFSLVTGKGLRSKPLPEVVQIFSGLYLALFLINHVRAVLMARYGWHVESDFYFASGVARSYPSMLFFIPYYSFSILAVFAHIASAHYNRRQQLSRSAAIQASRHKREALLIGAVGIVAMILIMIPLLFA